MVAILVDFILLMFMFMSMPMFVPMILHIYSGSSCCTSSGSGSGSVVPFVSIFLVLFSGLIPLSQFPRRSDGKNRHNTIPSLLLCICVGAYVLKCVLSSCQNIVLRGENKVQYALRRKRKKSGK